MQLSMLRGRHCPCPRRFRIAHSATATVSPARAVPSSRIRTKMPSRGITQSPVFLRISQSAWHSFPICVTSASAVPIRSRVPMGSDFSSMPRVRTFSAKTPEPARP